MKIIFLGTPEFAINSLDALYNSNNEVIAVVCQPDKPIGRGGKIVPCAVKKYAIEHNIPIYQFQKIRLEGVEPLKALNADVMVTCAYGQILSKELLDLTPNGVINIHGSLLPKHRGAAPIQYTIINGESTSGISILRSDVGIDDGKVMLERELKVLPNETAGELAERLSVLGSSCIIEALDLIQCGKAEFTSQDESQATFTKMLKPENAQIDFTKSAFEVKNFINGYNPSPVAFFMLKGKRFKVYNAHMIEKDDIRIKDKKECVIGEVVVAKSKQGLIIKCGEGFVSIDKIQAENGKVLFIKDFLNGNAIIEGEIANE